MRYKKKPIIIDAFKYGFDKSPEWFNEQVAKLNVLTYTNERLPNNKDKTIPKKGYFCSLDTLEGTMRCNWGDYIIKGVIGELYPCRGDIFEATYEEVKEK